MDTEKAVAYDNSPGHVSSDNGTSGHNLPVYGESSTTRGTYSQRFISSFKRDPNARATARTATGADGKVYDLEGAAQATAESPLARKLKGRHLQMIAIGGSIGTFEDEIHHGTQHQHRSRLTTLAQVPVSLSDRARRWPTEARRPS